MNLDTVSCSFSLASDEFVILIASDITLRPVWPIWCSCLIHFFTFCFPRCTNNLVLTFSWLLRIPHLLKLYLISIGKSYGIGEMSMNHTLWCIIPESLLKLCQIGQSSIIRSHLKANSSLIHFNFSMQKLLTITSGQICYTLSSIWICSMEQNY